LSEALNGDCLMAVKNNEHRFLISEVFGMEL